MNRLWLRLKDFTQKSRAPLTGSSFSRLPRLAAVSILLAGFALGVRAAVEIGGEYRLTPLSVTVEPLNTLSAKVQDLETATIGRAFDRDTGTSFMAHGESRVTVRFEAGEEIHGLRVFGPAPYRVRVSALDAQGNSSDITDWGRLDWTQLGAGWNGFELQTPVQAAGLVLDLAPAPGSPAPGLSEVEFWGKGSAGNLADGAAWDQWFSSASAPESLLACGREYSAGPATLVVGNPGGTGTSGPLSASVTVNLPVPGASYRRAWLLYSMEGLSHWIAPARSINGMASAQGWPLPGTSTWNSQCEPIHPAWLHAGPNIITFSLPSGVSTGYSLSNVRVVAEEDNGSNLIDQVQASAGDAGNLLDGDKTTGWRPYVDGLAPVGPPSLTFQLYRTAQVERLRLYVVNPIPGHVDVRVLQNRQWVRLGDETEGEGLGAGWQEVAIAAKEGVDAVQLQFKGGAGSAGEIMEALAEGSGEGGPYGRTLEVSYPDQGQFYGRMAYIRGFLGQDHDDSGEAQVLAGAQELTVKDGQFEGLVSKEDMGFASQADSEAWAVTLMALYPDGAQLSRVVQLNQEMGGNSAVTGQSGTYAAPLSPGQPQTVAQLGATLAMDASALATKVNLQIVPLTTTDLAPLNPGMTNVTGGPYSGFRFLPHGTHFEEPVTLSLPLDAALLPRGKTAQDVQTFYYDTDRGMWVPLQSTSVSGSGSVQSLTNHFTDFINATLTVPDHPGEVDFNPTQLKNMKAAGPGSGINLMGAPAANNDGTASLSYPIEIPPGRGGIQPSLSVRYDSSAQNSWMGMGWDLAVPSITVETRWGAPRFDGATETETYLLDGQALLEETAPGAYYLAHRMLSNGQFAPRLGDPVTFHTRVEGGFGRILRHGTLPSNYWWEVTDKDGMTSFFGGSRDDGGKYAGAILADGSSNGFQWALRETKDTHGNCVLYHYDQVSTPLGSGLYLGRVNYTGLNGSDGPYAARFFHGTGVYQAGGGPVTQQRPDVRTDGRGGFLRATADLLDHIDITLNGSLVRRYQFTYVTGAFSKTLLGSIQQFGSGGGPFPGNLHTFKYFNDIQDGSGNYNGFAVTTWNSPSNGVNTLALLPANSIETSENTGGGGHLYVGYAPPFDFDKYFSAGGKLGLSGSDGDGKMALMDINGDGLPDLVYKDSGGNIWFRPNQSGPNGSFQFGPPQPVLGINDISKDSSFMVSGGPEAYVGINLIDNISSNWDTESVYFTDANGDGIPDLVNNGTVYFGHVDLSGNVSYSTDSTGTYNPLGAGNSVTGTGPDYSSAYSQTAGSDPLVDNLKQWTAPFNGVVSISAPVTLVSDAPATYTSADGVNALIEFHPGAPAGGTVLAQASVSLSGQVQPLSAAATVAKGDRLYFRLQSVYDGRYDQVGWNPAVQYTSFTAPVTAPVPDANGLDSSLYQALGDFTCAGSRGIAANMPFTGIVRLQGDLSKLGPTTDDLRLLVVKISSSTTIISTSTSQNSTVSSGAQTVLDQTLAFNQGPATVRMSSAAGGFTVGSQVSGGVTSTYVDIPVQNTRSTPVTTTPGGVTTTTNVSLVDQLQFQVLADSNVDLSRIHWTPKVFYLAATDQQGNPVTVTDRNKNHIITLNAPYDIQFYPENTLSTPLAAVSVTDPLFTASAPPFVLPVGTPLPVNTGILRMDSAMTISGPVSMGAGLSVTVLVNSSPAFTQAVAPQTLLSGASTVIQVAGDLAGLVDAEGNTLGAPSSLEVVMGAGSQGDLNQVAWIPALYYVNPYSADPKPEISGSVTFQPSYKVALGTGGARIRYYLQPQVQVNDGPIIFPYSLGKGSLAFTAKKSLSRSAKQIIDLTSIASTTIAGGIQYVNNAASPVTFEEAAGTPLYFGFTSPAEDMTVTLLGTPITQAVAAEVTAYSVQALGLTFPSSVPVPCSLDTPGNYPETLPDGNSTVFMSPYRGWAYADLKANGSGPITDIASASSPPGPLAETDLELPVIASGAAATAISSAVQDMKGIVLYPDFTLQQWSGPTTEIFTAPATVGSSRLTKDVLGVPLPPSGPTTGLGGVGLSGIPSRTSQSLAVNVLGFGIGPLSGSSTTSPGTGDSTGDYMDLNGDGYPDILSKGNVLYTLPSGVPGASAITPTNWGGSLHVSSNSVSNIGIGGNPAAFFQDGEGRAGPSGGGGGEKGESGGSQMQPIGFGISVGLEQGGSSQTYDLIDMNGDGLPDEVSLSGSTLVVNLNRGYGFAPPVTWTASAINESSTTSVNGGVGFNDGIYGFAGGASAVTTVSTTNATLQDMNGDGLPDLVTNAGGGNLSVAINTGSGFAAPVLWRGAASDLARNNGFTIGGGVYFTIPISLAIFGTIIINPGGDFSTSANQQQVKMMDINGDGYPDQLESTGDGSLTVHLNQAGRTNLLREVDRPMGGVIQMDYQRGGNTLRDPNNHWNLSQVSIYDGGMNANASKGGADYQLTHYTYGTGKYDRYDREFLGYDAVTATQMDTKGLNGSNLGAAPPYREVIQSYYNGSLYEKGLLREEILDDLSGGTARTFTDTLDQYQLWDVALGSAIAFGTPGTSLLTNRIFPRLVEQDKSFLEGGSQAVSTYMTYAYDSLGNVTSYFDAGDPGASPSDAVSATVSYTASDPAFTPSYLVGLPATILVMDSGGTVLRHREATYTPATGDLSEVRHYLDAANTAVDDFTYDSYGNLIQETSPANLNNQRYSLVYQYDSVLNTYPVFTRDSLGYTSTETYDLRFGKPAVDVDENNNQTRRTYDDFGRAVTVVGPFEAASGHYTLAFDYHPDAVIPFAHTSHYDPYRDPNDPIDMVEFTDGLGRVIQEKKDATIFTGAKSPPQDMMTVSGRIIFDHAGRPIREYAPVTESLGSGGTFNPSFDPVQPAALQYDILGRETQVIIPDGSSVTLSYGVTMNGQNQFLARVVDADLNEKDSVQNARGFVTQTLEHNVTQSQVLATQYQYDPLDELTQVIDAKGNRTSSRYDAFGRRISLTNPDTGKTLMAYDLAGNLTRETTANLAKEGTSIAFNYDGANRMTGVQYPDFKRNNVTYFYGLPGAPFNQANRVARLTDGSGSGIYNYDAMGNEVKETRVVSVPVAGQWPTTTAWDLGQNPTQPVTYITQYTFDDWGRMQNMTYPDGEVLTYQYDSAGMPRAVAGVNQGKAYPYLLRLEYDKFGSRAFVQNGNGTQSFYNYDPRTRRLSALVSASGAVTFQNLGYGYDPEGNITSLINNVPVVQDGLGGPVSQNFVYDGLYRLINARGGFHGAFDPNSGQVMDGQYNLTMDYDAIHNISSKNQLAQIRTGSTGAFSTDTSKSYNWNYTYAGPGPHAPTLIGTRAFSYDANGNQTGYQEQAGANRQIRWDEENRVEEIQDGNGTLAGDDLRFVYDAGGSRVLKIDNPDKMTAYVNQFYTVENPQSGDNSLADKHVYIGESRILTKMVQGATSSTGGSTGNPPPAVQWIGPWGEAHGNADGDWASWGGPVNFVTAKSDGVPVYSAVPVWTKETPALGTVNSCQTLTLLNPKPQDGFFQVSYNNQAGYIAENSVVVGLPDNCIPSTQASLLPQDALIFYYHGDHLGSTGYMTDRNGKLTEHLEYFPFGETWLNQQSGLKLFPDYLFTGKELDGETGLYDFGARYYDPRTSVWQSADPMLGSVMDKGDIASPLNLSLYAYGYQNPLKFVDPDGASPKFILIGERMWRVHAVRQYMISHGVPKEDIITFGITGNTQAYFNSGQALKNVAVAFSKFGLKARNLRVVGQVGGYIENKDWLRNKLKENAGNITVVDVGEDPGAPYRSIYYQLEKRIVGELKPNIVKITAKIREVKPATAGGDVTGVIEGSLGRESENLTDEQHKALARAGIKRVWATVKPSGAQLTGGSGVKPSQSYK